MSHVGEERTVLRSSILQAIRVHSGKPGIPYIYTIKAHGQAPVSPETPETLPGSWARQTSEVGFYFRASFIITHLGLFNPMSLTDAPFCGDCLI